MNHMKEVTHMLGVELGEEFKIKSDHFKYKITERGLERFDSYDNCWYLVAPTLVELLLGDSKIIKLPKPILDDVEKEYLSNVIKPFRDSVISICKHNLRGYEYVCTIFYDKFYCNKNCFSLPLFEKGTMYKGMELDKQYTLEELGL